MRSRLAIVPDCPEMLDTIEVAVAEIAAGRMVIVVDDDSSGGGAVVAAAQFASGRMIRFMSHEGGGWMCLALTAERCDELGLDIMAAHHEHARQTPIMVSIDARDGLTNGTSAADRARTIEVAVDPAASASDLIVPGHVVPVKVRRAGVLERGGHAEAGVDLARAAGCNPSAVVATVQNEDGSDARMGELRALAARHGLAIVRIVDLVAHRRRRERVVERAVSTRLPTRFGEFRAVGYRSLVDGLEHLALVAGDLSGPEPVLVRVHTECLIGDAFHGLLCDCGEILDRSLEAIAREGRGVLVHLAQRAYGLGWLARRGGPAPTELRDIGIGAAILADLGLRSIRILTDHPHQIHALEGHDLVVEQQIPIHAPHRLPGA
jgi:3,4-dihydroxy 2-butanone 4-phosphate synthase/GTP cyclohydrolase II